MDEKALFLKFWEKEAPATRKVISRIPQARSDYRADPKARTAREIAWLIVREEIALVEALEKGVFEWVEVSTPSTVQEIVDIYDLRHDDLTKRLQGLDTARWEGEVPFVFEGQEAFRDTGYRNRVGRAVRSHPPSRTALDVSASDGFDGARHLRSERGRVHVTACRRDESA